MSQSNGDNLQAEETPVDKMSPDWPITNTDHGMLVARRTFLGIGIIGYWRYPDDISTSTFERMPRGGSAATMARTAALARLEEGE